MLVKPAVHRYARSLFILATLSAVLLMQGCFWESDDPAPPPATYSIGGTVTGLTGTVVLQNNASSDLTITTNGSFSFGDDFSNGTSYDVTVLTDPSGQSCSVNNGKGSVNGAAVSNIAVTCVDNADPVGYYKDGTLTDTGGTVVDTAFQAIAYNGRLMMVSVTTGLLYDGEMTIAENSYTMTAIVYKDGIKESSTVNITGNINAGSDITGDISDGRSFTLKFAMSNNNETSNLMNILREYPVSWAAEIGGSDASDYYEFEHNPAGTIKHQIAINTGTFENCEMNGTIKAIANTNLFSVSVSLTSCSKIDDATNYTGLAVSEDPYGTLVFMVANNVNGFGANFQ